MRLREIRQEKRVTQRELGAQIGVNSSVISKYERGLIMPPVDKVVLMAKYLNVDVNDILGSHSEQQSATAEKDLDYNMETPTQDSSSAYDLLTARYALAHCFHEENPLDLQYEPRWDKIDFKALVMILAVASPRISQVKLAKKLNISPMTLSRMLSSSNCPIRKEWIPVLSEYLLSLDFSNFDETFKHLKATAVYVKKEKRLNDVTQLLIRALSVYSPNYTYDEHFWGRQRGIIRFVDYASNSQWLFALGSEEDADIWMCNSSGLGPFSQFLKRQLPLTDKDKVSVFYLDSNLFNRSIDMSFYPKSIREAYSGFSPFEDIKKFPCIQSLMLFSQDKTSVESEFFLPYCEGEKNDI